MSGFFTFFNKYDPLQQLGKKADPLYEYQPLAYLEKEERGNPFDGYDNVSTMKRMQPTAETPLLGGGMFDPQTMKAGEKMQPVVGQTPLFGGGVYEGDEKQRGLRGLLEKFGDLYGQGGQVRNATSSLMPDASMQQAQAKALRQGGRYG